LAGHQNGLDSWYTIVYIRGGCICFDL
jgi:hypothetical protein